MAASPSTANSVAPTEVVLQSSITAAAGEASGSKRKRTGRMREQLKRERQEQEAAKETSEQSPISNPDATLDNGTDKGVAAVGFVEGAQEDDVQQASASSPPRAAMDHTADNDDEDNDRMDYDQADESIMSYSSEPPPPPTKKKRTGKMREQMKKEAIARAAEAAAAAPAGATTTGASIENGVQSDSTSTAERNEEVLNLDGEIQKRSDNDAMEVDADEEDSKPKIDLESISTRVPQALKSLHPILKKAKTMETQRLIKKVKFLRTKEPDSSELKDLETQLEYLKKMDLHLVLSPLLSLKMKKHNLVKSEGIVIPSDFLPTPVALPSSSTGSNGNPDEREAIRSKVENRICSSKGTAEAITKIVAWLVGEPGARLSGLQKGNAAAAKQGPSAPAEKGKGKEDGQNMKAQARNAVSDLLNAGKSKAKEGVTSEPMDGGWESESVGGDSDSDSDSDASDDSGVIDDADFDDVPSASSNSNRPTKLAKQSKAELASESRAAAKSSKEPIKSSMFLPSLAVGYTAGDFSDDDDFDPDEDERKDRKTDKRKNRRGQQERRAIWEKKYGKGANHLKEENKKQELAGKFLAAQSGVEYTPGQSGANTGGKTYGGARGGYGFDKRNKKEGAKVVEDAGWGGRPVHASAGGNSTGDRGKPYDRPSAASSAATAKSAADKDKPVHPSWEAARKRKEMQMAMSKALSSGGAGAGVRPKKIVFD